MLSVQVDYWKLQEDKRHNMAMEQWNNANLSETERHNRASENYNYDVLSENKRHNLATEQYYTANLDEMKRHNISEEGIKWYTAETSRRELPFKQMQAEAARDSSSAKLQDSSTNYFNATTNRLNAKTKQGEAKASTFKDTTQGMSNLWNMGTGLLKSVSGALGSLGSGFNSGFTQIKLWK